MSRGVRGILGLGNEYLAWASKISKPTRGRWFPIQVKAITKCVNLTARWVPEPKEKNVCQHWSPGQRLSKARQNANILPIPNGRELSGPMRAASKARIVRRTHVLGTSSDDAPNHDWFSSKRANICSNLSKTVATTTLARWIQIRTISS